MAIKILSLQTCTVLAGTELMTFRKYNYINKSKFDLTVCFLENRGPISDMYIASGISKIYHLNNKSYFQSICKLYWILDRNKFDIIHTNGLKISIIARILSLFTHNKIIIHSQNSVDEWRKQYHIILDRITSGFVKKYIANNNPTKIVLNKREKISLDKIIVIHNGIDIELYKKKDPGLIRQEYNINNETIVITCVANLRNAKNHLFLLDVCNKLSEINIDFVFLFVGDGPLKSIVKKRIKEYGLELKVLILGSRSDVKQILADSNIFVLGSLWEGLPGSIMEAMASSLPVVATDVGGISELVIHDKTGYLCKSNDIIDMTRKLKYLIYNVQVRDRMGKEGLNHIKTNFQLKQKVSELEACYESIVSA